MPCVRHAGRRRGADQDHLLDPRRGDLFDQSAGQLRAIAVTEGDLPHPGDGQIDGDRRAEAARAGFLKGVDAKKGLGLVTLDGETVWEKAAAFLVPHPILLPELDDFRALAAELSLTQASKQLFREVFTKPKDLKEEDEEIATFRGGKFEEVSHARGAAKSLGYRCTAGWVATRVFDGGRSIEARYWIGGDEGEGEAYTEGLSWVDENDKTLRVAEVPKVAFSEGMRMASAVYGKRAIEKKEESDA